LNRSSVIFSNTIGRHLKLVAGARELQATPLKSAAAASFEVIRICFVCKIAELRRIWRKRAVSPNRPRAVCAAPPKPAMQTLATAVFFSASVDAATPSQRRSMKDLRAGWRLLATAAVRPKSDPTPRAFFHPARSFCFGLQKSF
jgi:hypothetical protein